MVNMAPKHAGSKLPALIWLFDERACDASLIDESESGTTRRRVKIAVIQRFSQSVAELRELDQPFQDTGLIRAFSSR